MSDSKKLGISKIDCFLHQFCDNHKDIVVWRETGMPGIDYYYAEERLYVLRAGIPGSNCAFGFVKAGDPFEAAKMWIQN